MEPKEVRNEWSSRLRSGKWKQTRHMLNRYNEGYCCLGVLCEFALEEGIITKPDQKGTYIPYRDDIRSWDVSLPPAVQKWAGLCGNNGEFLDINTKKPNSLALMNDDWAPFSKIADIIDSEPEGLVCS